MRNKRDSFWLSYSDLMTSLFSVMLVLFIVSIVKMRGIDAELDRAANTAKEQLERVEKLDNSIKEIDNKCFKYDEQSKKHALRDIDVSLDTYSSNIQDIEKEQLGKLLKAGEAIILFIQNVKTKIPEAQYLLIVEGQSSRDNYIKNYELSHGKALVLIKFWSTNSIEFGSLSNCGILISGSGQSGKFRVQPDIRGNKDNQGSVIHIIPKPGIIEWKSKIRQKNGRKGFFCRDLYFYDKSYSKK